MKATIGMMVVLLGSLIGAPTATAGWRLPSPSNLSQLGAACDDYYVAMTENKRQLHLMLAIDALTRIKTEDQITEQKMIATLKKYKSIKPKSVAVVILALDICKPQKLKAVVETIATPQAVNWAKGIVVPSGVK